MVFIILLFTRTLQAFDLLDALSRSGALELRFCQTHVVILQTHCFAQSLMHTLVRDNINPIEHVERTQLLVASELFNVPARKLLRAKERDRIAKHSPQLFEERN